MVIVRLRDLAPNEAAFFGIRKRSSIKLQPYPEALVPGWWIVKATRNSSDEQVATVVNHCSDVVEVKFVDQEKK